jgi:hypothetical protein
MIAADGFAVLTLGGDTKVDQKPRKMPAQPCSPSVGMTWVPVHEKKGTTRAATDACAIRPQSPKMWCIGS